jgi:hypothetical protein
VLTQRTKVKLIHFLGLVRQGLQDVGEAFRNKQFIVIETTRFKGCEKVFKGGAAFGETMTNDVNYEGQKKWGYLRVQYCASFSESFQHWRSKGKESWGQRICDLRFYPWNAFEEIEYSLIIDLLELPKFFSLHLVQRYVILEY